MRPVLPKTVKREREEHLRERVCKEVRESREPDAIMVCNVDGTPNWDDVLPCPMIEGDANRYALLHKRSGKVRKVYLDTPALAGGDDSLLDDLLDALGWDGDNFHENVIAEVKRLKGREETCETLLAKAPEEVKRLRAEVEVEREERVAAEELLGGVREEHVAAVAEVSRLSKALDGARRETESVRVAARELQRKLDELSKQEPVAWRRKHNGELNYYATDRNLADHWVEDGYTVESLYVAPKPATPFAEQAEQIRQEQADVPEHKRVPSIDHASRADARVVDWLGKQVKKVATEQATKPDHNRVPSLRSESAPADTPSRQWRRPADIGEEGDYITTTDPERVKKWRRLGCEIEEVLTPAMVEADRLLREGWEPGPTTASHYAWHRDKIRTQKVGHVVVDAMRALRGSK